MGKQRAELVATAVAKVVPAIPGRGLGLGAAASGENPPGGWPRAAGRAA